MLPHDGHTCAVDPDRLSFLTVSKKLFVPTSLQSAASMDLDGGFRKARLDKQTLDLLPMIALKKYEAIFRCSTASAVGLELGSQIVEIDALRINPLDDSGSLTPLSSLKADLNKLLFHTDGSADT